MRGGAGLLRPEMFPVRNQTVLPAFYGMSGLWPAIREL
jgi:hypothetical protein